MCVTHKRTHRAKTTTKRRETAVLEGFVSIVLKHRKRLLCQTGAVPRGTPPQAPSAPTGGPRRQRTRCPASPPPCLHAVGGRGGPTPAARAWPRGLRGCGAPPSTGRHLGRTAPSGVTPSPGLPRMERLLPYRQPIHPSVPDFFFKVRDTLEKKMVTFPTRKKKC